MKNIVLLGSTGSVGENAIRVAKALPKELRITGISVASNYARAIEQAKELGIRHIAVANKELAGACRTAAPRGTHVYAGPEGLEELAALSGTNMVLSAIVGVAGLPPVMSALRHGIDVALATKEVMVAAGAMVKQLCKRHGARLIPVDSEHSALFQCLKHDDSPHGRVSPVDVREVRRFILTASGGPFGNQPKLDFSKVTVAQALKHPKWKMGPKISIDSATLMNKGLEILEAHWLFDVPVDQIDVIIHPQSIIHSLVEFADGHMLAHMCPTDMRFAIQYALTYPKRLDGGLVSLDLAKLGALEFLKPDPKRFPALNLARQAAQIGGTAPAVLNAANEVAVQRFLSKEINFPGIWKTVGAVLNRHHAVSKPSLGDIIEADRWAREAAQNAGHRTTRN